MTCVSKIELSLDSAAWADSRSKNYNYRVLILKKSANIKLVCLLVSWAHYATRDVCTVGGFYWKFDLSSGWHQVYRKF